MLYQLHEMRRSLMGPLTQWAEAYAELLSNPISPLAHSPFSQRIAAGYELMFRIGKDYKKPEFKLDPVLINDKPVDIAEELTEKKSFCNLIHFKKDLSNKEIAALKQPKVLLVAPLSGHHSTLLRDTVQKLLEEHDVYITDWIDARMVPLSEGPFHLHDYIYYVQDFIRLLLSLIHI